MHPTLMPDLRPNFHAEFVQGSRPASTKPHPRVEVIMNRTSSTNRMERRELTRAPE
jgi:hypothetical protein